MPFALEVCLKCPTAMTSWVPSLILKPLLAEINNLRRGDYSGKTIFLIGRLTLFDVSEVEN